MLALLLAACGGGGSDGGRIDAAASDLATADLAVGSDLAGVDLGGVDLAGADLATPLDLAWVAPIDLGPPPDGFGAYPAGPYGSTAGAVVPDFTFQGYFSGLATSGLSSSQPFAAASFDTARTSGARALLVMFAGFT